MSKKLLIRATLLLLLLFPLSALSAITLEEAMQMGRANNLSLASTSIDVNAAKRDVDTSWNLFIPSLSLSLSNAGTTPVFKASPGSSAINTGLGFSLSATLTLNPAVKSQMDSYQIGYQIQQVSYEQAKAEVERTITKLFYYLVMEEQNIAVQQANLELAQKQYEEVTLKYEQGFASELEVLTSQLASERLKPSLQQATNQYASNLLSLKAMLGMELDEELSVEGEIPALIKELEVQDLKEYLQKSYSIALLDLNMAQLRTTIDLNSQQALLPTIMIKGTYEMSLWNEMNPVSDFSDSSMYTIALSIPLDGFIPNSRTKVGLAKLDDSLQKLALQRQQAVKQLEVSVVGKVQNLNMLSSQAQLAQQSLELTEKVYIMNHIQYESGYIGSVALEEAQNNLLGARQQVLSLQFQYVSSLIDLIYDLNIQHEYRTKELI
ncbi:TolC family protein [Sphaerochaeta globosa]|uniref:Outer membrane efflux protein n=1 Tax=Sphaerochaeta globosa (strain ATCC BAA-1886 / DSM 22777 / Buddy) TaxID=158189 RepID=F0RW52_SPHGB|nr:TolC family protein [Sphaerochaeta globosa]ADY13409.1 outer membrane efflux protein [Sphaerochaeta globosa str. Buddy]